MTDNIDRASEIEEKARQQAIQHQRLKMVHNYRQVENCIDCDEPLHPVRVQMQCLRCVDCQSLIEQKQKGYAK